MISGNPFSLSGKNIVVTGASSGIGRECSILCSHLGARIILIARDEERLNETRNSMFAPNDHLVISLDINGTSRMQETILEKKDQIGDVHGVVHCAGISTTLPLRMISESHLQRFFQTNVYAAIHLTRIFSLPRFMPSGGSIVLISSVMGVVGEAGKALYSLTKGALVAGAKSLAVELAPRRIRVNCISPGVVLTPMSSKAFYSQDQASLDLIKSYHPLGLGEAQDIANACVFLVSDASRWITGSNLMVDGGYTAR